MRFYEALIESCNDLGSAKARSVYNVTHWSDGYFDINDHNCGVSGWRSNQTCYYSLELTEQFKAQGLTLPVLIRVTDILKHRVDTLTQAFTQARAQRDYQGQ